MTNPNIHADEPTALYRLYDANDRLLYIGIARHPKFRWEQHANDKPWWHLVARKTVEWCDDRSSALNAERGATAEEKPLYDRSGSYTSDTFKVSFDDSEGRRVVTETLTSKIEKGVYPPGTLLVTGTVAQECGVSRTTASFAMRALADRGGLLRFQIHGRYRVVDHRAPGAEPSPASQGTTGAAGGLLLPAPRFRDRTVQAPAPVVKNPSDRSHQVDRQPKPGCIRAWQGQCQRPPGMTCDC